MNQEERIQEAIKKAEKAYPCEHIGKDVLAACPSCELALAWGRIAKVEELLKQKSLIIAKMGGALREAIRVFELLPNRPVIGSEGEALIFAQMWNQCREALTPDIEALVKENRERDAVIKAARASVEWHMSKKLYHVVDSNLKDALDAYAKVS